MKNIVILATGGTIAGAGELGKNIGYKSGSIKAQTLIDAIPELKNVANICVEQVCNINSDDVTSEIWIALAKRIQELLLRDDVDGIVIMHGTDTMEETALFLSLTLGGSAPSAAEIAAKPVIMTGSMRPATAAEPDGPANLLFAVKSVVEMSAKNDATVYVAFAGKLMDARLVQKIHANDLDAFAELSSRTSFRDRHLVNAKKSFDISNLRELPRVTVLYFNADADAELVRFAAERSAGLIIAGAGAGEFSRAWADAITDAVAEKNIPVVISTRINRGSIVPEQLLVPETIAAYDLPPAKVAVLLRLALTVTNDPAEIQKIYQMYT
ncbi:L-asparaginase II [Fibrobacter succinogenes subsp. succinogenes S85]|uniref:Asparaginase n=1 Tax=Fibrobacter succinogenes (strain ATCC 19169 / S85) TaxID=59374 RepID=C9RM38_FIBSS|nr:asparaginase [Fibrobacter succinogenes]ACX74200.1 Asparaginase [Fibrobacter succinogenes subsp. succinogenes S85]ADL26899.1 L-asparaginase II [Fibrobacter succinogenes subsp. succinogenes S85]